MRINLSQAGKRFNREWIFRNTTLEFKQGNSYAITGSNGSGKSTLMQCIAGMMQLSEGSIQYTVGNMQMANEQAYKKISFCAPYLELIEEMNLIEFLNFHSRFKKLLAGVNTKMITEELKLDHTSQKQIRYYSSGMKQRVKLAQAVFSDTPIVLLDEPCTNLDTNGIDLYYSLITNYCKNRLVVVSSNDEVEYSFCKEKINLASFKN
jgi:ABC-type multidrug transport system ATPase subunit